MDNYVNVAGRMFPKELYNKLLTVFVEGFSHSSLSVEQAFTKIKEYNYAVNEIYAQNRDNFNALNFLSPDERKFAIDYLKYMIVFISVRRGSCECNLSDKDDINTKFNSLFPSLGSNLPYLVKLNSDGKFDPNLSYPLVIQVMEVLSNKNMVQREVTLMKQDYMNAFYYALNLDSIGVSDIKEINALVNENSANKAERGSFKKVNNQVSGAKFETCDKSLVPTKMAELIYNYNNNWGNPLPDIDLSTCPIDVRNKYLLDLCKREAHFHIDFIRIHPFEDGNGRTGRIILNAHLLKCGLAPVLITGEISRDYKKYIEDYDVSKFGHEIFNWSSQELTRWISELRFYKNVSPDQVEFDSTSIDMPKIK